MTEKIKYIGCDDPELDLFESQYELPEGMCYNSYLILDEKVAVMDSVDKRKTAEWLDKLEKALEGRKPDYLIVQHMEPDHSGSVGAFRARYPEAVIVGSAKALQFAAQFEEKFDATLTKPVKEGEVLSLGQTNLQFFTAPMVHWPEVIMTYCPEEKVFFSADAFGKFGVYNADPDDWSCEGRRYYFNICGKYGAPVNAALRKASKYEIEAICPLHGPVLTGEKKDEAVRLYNIWSKYEVETKGVLVAHASIHGNTAKVAKKLAEMLEAKGAGKVAIIDLCRDDMAEAVEDAFRMGKLVVCASSYDADVFPPMHFFLWKLQMKGFQNRTVGIVENGSWAPSAGKAMKALIEPLKNVKVVEPMVTIKSSMKEADVPQLKALVDALLSE
jgi:flavorubredoxin